MPCEAKQHIMPNVTRAQGKRLNVRRQRVLTGILIGLLTGALAFGVSRTAPARQIENALLDLRFRQRGARPQETKVAVVALDDASLFDARQQVSGEPLVFWGTYFGEAIRRLAAMQAAAIGFDYDQAVDVPQNQALARAILLARGKVVLSQMQVQVEEGEWTLRGSVPTLATAANAAAKMGGVTQGQGVGLTNPYLEEDPDGVVRRHAPIAANMLTDSSPPLPTFGLLLAERVQPGIATKPFIINYLGPPQTVPRISFRRLLLPGAEQDAELQRVIQGAVVVIGRTDPGSGDFRQTPMGYMAGAEIHANIVATMLDGKPIHALAEPRPTLAALVTGVIVAVLVLTLGPVHAALAAVLSLLAWGSAAWLTFQAQDRWTPMVQPLLTMGLSFFAAAVWRQRTVESAVMKLSQYVGPVVAKQLRDDPHAMDAAIESEVTVMFTDIRGFTAWSQDKSPREAVDLINAVGGLLAPRVFAEEGTVDKFLGDGMMAFFGAPLLHEDHALRAVRCALEIQEAIAGSREAEALFPGLQLGVGLHTGSAVISYLKAQDKREYTAIGDTVNVAARMEEATKRFQAALVMSEATFRAAGPEGERLLRGKGYCLEGPCLYTPHNHAPVSVYVARRA